MVLLRVKPKLRAESALFALKSAEPNSTEAKSIAFALRSQIKDPIFAEVFISLGGISATLKLIKESSGTSIQIFYLGCLRKYTILCLSST